MKIYEMGRVQFYAGMTSLEDYVRFMCPKNSENNMNASHYMNLETLKEFLVDCFMEVKSMDVKWDNTAVNIWLGALPRANSNYPYRFVVFEQKENGDSFLVSELQLPLVGDKEVFPRECIIEKKYSKKDVFEWMKNCCRLADTIFEEISLLEKPERKYKKQETAKTVEISEKSKHDAVVIPSAKDNSIMSNELEGFVRIA